ncbi:LysR family transcriptional regulator [Sinomonas susongensis]|uniref:LysR family transcriptional regulator n=1 Tax=Sinomonas susongensis TaxID=1324851 RepID=UPI0011085C05|nr:LysR family transcriptional regulator [Sinomonas susongensis]
MKEADLNLLPALQALLELRNVSRAAERVHLSQPAMSAALSRLRRHFNDELLVRTGRSYELTAFAKALAPRVEEALLNVRDAMQLGAEFDPQESDRTFVVAASDYVTCLLIRNLRSRIAEAAPGIAVDFVTVPPLRPSAELEAFNAIDVIIGPMGFNLAGSSRQLFRDEFVVVMDAENPLLEAAELTVHHIAAAPQAVGEFGGSIVTPPMQFFRQMDEPPKVAARLAGLQALPTVVEGTDLVALVPRMLAARASLSHRIAVVEFAPELEVPLVEAMYWHPLQTADPANEWVRGVIQDAIRGLEQLPLQSHSVAITGPLVPGPF